MHHDIDALRSRAVWTLPPKEPITLLGLTPDFRILGISGISRILGRISGISGI